MSNLPASSLLFDDWPPADRAAWQQVIKEGGLFDEQGAAAQWAESTRASVQYDYGIWLRWCDRQGVLYPSSIGERVTPQSVRQYITDLESRISPVTLHSYLARLHRVITLFCPDTDWEWLQNIVNRLERLKAPSRDKASRIQDSGDLLELGQALMTSTTAPSAAHSHKERLKSAVQYRDGLMIALLATRPLRRTNFAMIQLGHHLIKQDGDWWLRFQAGETKQSRPIEQPIPSLLHGRLETYLKTYRPIFLGADRHDFLWASAKGGALTDEGFYQRIIKRTRLAFGKPVNPHLFRDCAATTIARRTPERVGIAAQILGHSNLATTERHYNQAGSVSASRHFQATLTAIKAGYPTRSGKRR